MTSIAEIVLALFLLTNITLAGTGRLRRAIRLVAAQGWMVGLLPLLLWNWSARGVPCPRVWLVAGVNAAIKGIALPVLLRFAADKAKAAFELEPLVGFRLSQAVAFLLAAASFAVGKALHIHEAVASELAIPVAFTTMGTGLFLICARRKAITQVLGFLAFENGIAVFGSGILLEYGLVVELGILLDVFVLVFVLGIAIYQINRTFSSIDTDRLNELGDVHLMKRRRLTD
ncbi:MAG: hydrogenase [Kiritimatiellia bacterium]